ncbi:MAG: CopG family ribbon-helix-helix protein [Candidatus Kariarchaeaceae archaeon]
MKRITISLPDEVCEKYQKMWPEKYVNQSEAIRAAIMEQLDGGEQLEEEEEYVGVITLVYNHHSTSFVGENLEIQHKYEDVIGVTTHIHMTHEKCYEMIQVRGKGKRLEELNQELRRIKSKLRGKSRYQTLFTRI